MPTPYRLFLARLVGTCLLASAVAAPSLPAAHKVTISDAVVVAQSGPNESRWGYYQFPNFDQTADGRIALTFHVARDSATAYGKIPEVPNRGISSDQGQTWALVKGSERLAGLKMPNGDRLSVGHPYDMPKALDPSTVRLPKPVASVPTTYGIARNTYYRHDELPADLQGVPQWRLSRDNKTWREERGRLDDPSLLRHTAEGLLPVVWWGDVHLASDGSLVALIYPSRIAGPEIGHGHITCYRSVDSGQSWQVRSRILYRADYSADPLGALRRDGFTEPAFAILPDGTFLCVMRTTDGNGNGPMYSSSSKDSGATWSLPKVIAPAGVMPRLLVLGNGTLVLSSGRPGVDLRFCSDGSGKSWSESEAIIASELTEDNQKLTCGYTSLMPLDDDSFLLAYSSFRHLGTDRQSRKAILVRQVTVRR